MSTNKKTPTIKVPTPRKTSQKVADQVTAGEVVEKVTTPKLTTRQRQVIHDQDALNQRIHKYNLSLEDIRIAQSEAQLEFDKIQREQLRIDQEMEVLMINQYHEKLLSQ